MRGTAAEKEVDIYATNLANQTTCRPPMHRKKWKKGYMYIHWVTPKVRLSLEIIVLNFCSVVLLLYKLTACSRGPCWEADSHLGSQRVSQPFMETQKIIPFLKRSRNWSLSRERRIHSTPSRPIKNMTLGAASGGTTFITTFVRICHLVLK